MVCQSFSLNPQFRHGRGLKQPSHSRRTQSKQPVERRSLSIDEGSMAIGQQTFANRVGLDSLRFE